MLDTAEGNDAHLLSQMDNIEDNIYINEDMLSDP
jgi:hypothetical protein